MNKYRIIKRTTSHFGKPNSEVYVVQQLRAVVRECERDADEIISWHDLYENQRYSEVESYMIKVAHRITEEVVEVF